VELGDSYQYAVLYVVGQDCLHKCQVFGSCSANSVAEEACEGIITGGQEGKMCQSIQVGAEMRQLLDLVIEA
jgi:hypothetical protein